VNPITVFKLGNSGSDARYSNYQIPVISSSLVRVRRACQIQQAENHSPAAQQHSSFITSPTHFMSPSPYDKNIGAWLRLREFAKAAMRCAKWGWRHPSSLTASLARFGSLLQLASHRPFFFLLGFEQPRWWWYRLLKVQPASSFSLCRPLSVRITSCPYSRLPSSTPLPLSGKQSLPPRARQSRRRLKTDATFRVY
jgi:hypothetical protein